MSKDAQSPLYINGEIWFNRRCCNSQPLIELVAVCEERANGRKVVRERDKGKKKTKEKKDDEGGREIESLGKRGSEIEEKRC